MRKVLLTAGMAILSHSLIAQTHIVTDVSNIHTSTAVVKMNEKSFAAIVDMPLALGIGSSDATSDNKNGSISVSVSGGTEPYTYLWNTGATTPDIQNLSSGIYTITVTDANGKTIMGVEQLSVIQIIPIAPLTVTGTTNTSVEITPKIDEDHRFQTSYEEFNLELYPNPASTSTHLKIKGDSEIYTVVLTDIAGNIISSEVTDLKEMDINISGLSSGIYIFKILSKEGFEKSMRFAVE